MSRTSDSTGDASPRTCAAVLRADSDAILDAWARRVRQQLPAARELERPILTNTFPVLLDALVEALRDDHSRRLATEGSSVASEHGGERARMTRYAPDHLIAELRLLRDVVVTWLDDAGVLKPEHREVIRQSFELAVQQSMMAYFLVHTQIRERTVATLTHDMRTPLQSVSMASELIEQLSEGTPSAEDLEKIHTFAVRIKKTVQRADTLLAELLDTIAKRFTEAPQPALEAGEIIALLEGVVDQLDPPVRHKVRVRGERIEGHWNLGELHRAFENLINNAIKYGSSETNIEVTVEARRERLVVTVHNHGEPIPIEEQGRIFHAYHRVDDARQGRARGWGLGLSQVRHVAESHGGSIAVNSSTTEGTAFTFDIPIDSRNHAGANTLEDEY